MSALAASPWTRRTRIGTISALMCGCGLVVLGAVGAAAEDSVPDEIPWLNVGVMGLVVGGATNILWLLAGRRAVTLARNDVVALYAADLERLAGPAIVPPGHDRLLTVAGSTWYHRPGCLLTAGKPVVDVRTDQRLDACQVCAG